MTEAILLRRLPRPLSVDRVILPGRFRGNLDALTKELGVPFVRGPDEISDLPAYLGRGGAPADLTRYDIRIFAEIVDASALPVDALVTRARTLRAKGADVIDLGCLPDTPFPHLENAVRELKAAGLKVSVDSFNHEELRRGALAGADFLLSLDEATLDIAEGTATTPILVGSPVHDLDSLVRGAEAFTAGPALHHRPNSRSHPFRLRTSILRYAEARRRLPEAEMMMGTGNLTELTEVDFRRPHRRVDRPLLGAQNPQCADRAGQPAYAAHARGA